MDVVYIVRHMYPTAQRADVSACEAGVSMEPGVKRGSASETPGMRHEILWSAESRRENRSNTSPIQSIRESSFDLKSVTFSGK